MNIEKTKKSCPSGARHSSTCLSIREPSNTRNFTDSSSDDGDVPSQLATFHTCSALTSIATLEQGESSKGRKRSYDSARYASLTPEQRKAKQDRQRARRQSLTPEVREEINARRRNQMQSLSPEEREDKNARRRARRQSLPPEKRHALLDQRKASYTIRRDTPCAESIAMRYPKLGSSPASTSANGTVLEDVMDVDTILEPSASLVANPSPITPSSIVGNGGALGTLLEDVMNEDTTPEPGTSPTTNPPSSMPTFTIGTDVDLDNFLKDAMDEDTIPEEEMDA